MPGNSIGGMANLSDSGVEKMKNDYTYLDAAIIRRIKDGASEFKSIHSGKVEAEALAITFMNRENTYELSRYTDRRLQALRKKGVIVYRNREWRINDEQ